MAEDVKIPVGGETGADAPDAKEVRITDEGSRGGGNQYEVSVSSETPEETERPEWLDEKFESPEALAEAYKNLEQKIGGEAPEKLETIEGAPEVAEIGDIDQSKLEPFAKEYFEKGELSEDSFGQLEGMGLSRDIVTAFIDGQRAQQQQEVNKIHDIAGGQDKYQETLVWARANLSEAEVQAYNNTVESGDYDAAAIAVKGLQARHHQAEGSPPQLLKSEPEGPGGPSPYESIAQLTADMQSEDYKKDPAFRKKVENRLAISDIMG